MCGAHIYTWYFWNAWMCIFFFFSPSRSLARSSFLSHSPTILKTKQFRALVLLKLDLLKSKSSSLNWNCSLIEPRPIEPKHSTTHSPIHMLFISRDRTKLSLKNSSIKLNEFFFFGLSPSPLLMFSSLFSFVNCFYTLIRKRAAPVKRNSNCRRIFQ